MSLDVIMPLDLLRDGEWAEVTDIAGEASWVARMAELGLRIGCRVQMVRGGSPCMLQVGGCRLCLRGDQVQHILVRPGSHN